MRSCVNIHDFCASVLYQDASILAINKPAGVSVQGGTNITYHIDSMLDVLQFSASERPRLVHRLDKNTSGVLLLARTAASAVVLTKVFRLHAVRKVYWAIVTGVPEKISGQISAPLFKQSSLYGEKIIIDTRTGLTATTRYRVIRTTCDKSAAWLELQPKTGRTHQIRVHCALMGTPILGDIKYGSYVNHIPILHLHACLLAIPSSAEGILHITAPLSSKVVRTLAFLGF